MNAIWKTLRELAKELYCWRCQRITPHSWTGVHWCCDHCGTATQ